MSQPFTNSLSEHIWNTKYRYAGGGEARDRTLADSWRRVARSLAAVEQDSDKWTAEFQRILEDFRFLPGGRIQAGAGTQRRVTLFNCFVMGEIEDSLDSIFDNLKEGAITMQAGGGVGYDFSTLRPAGSTASATGRVASGPVSFMHIWDAMCATILSTGERRGAMMATLRCDHPDIEAFVAAKREAGRLQHFNLSVLVTDAFMQAVEADADWPLVFPVDGLATPPEGEGDTMERTWSGRQSPVTCRVLKRVSARALWDEIMRATYDHAEPGVLFVDRINANNNLWYREHISATNPCGEIPLPQYGACDLGSVNLTRFVVEPFGASARLDLDGIRDTVAVGVRLLDNVTDASRYPLAQQAEQARGCRRIGLGVTGLADALIMLGLRYDSEAAHTQAEAVMAAICHTAYRTSIELAREKGAFPFFDAERYPASEFIQSLPEDIRDGIAEHGIRNSHLTAIAPTGTISLLANAVSSGIEPVFSYRHSRRVYAGEGAFQRYQVTDYAYHVWQSLHPDAEDLPESFVDARSLAPEAHLRMQAVFQPYVDSSISKTINIPEDFPFEDFESVYAEAYRLGLKGCTTFRPNPVTNEILSVDTGEAGIDNARCCSMEREPD